ncbi:sigma 54-interacting transcriptional regulator [Boseaceae bacterium BT-24-1]|nr:sigma 54-interacting transcriptional regulator [Boseaceae bacterium BT-24-1]
MPTGARDRSKPGKFELASGGVLLLDEIGDMPLPLQGSLLRVLQVNQIVWVGGTIRVATDVRVICATNQPLAQLVKAGRFRDDLYHRLNMLPIEVSALRERGDIEYLAEKLLARISSQLAKPSLKLAAKDCQALLWHSWPGNVRELENVLTRLVVTGKLLLSSSRLSPVPVLKSPSPLLKERIHSLAGAEIRSALERTRGNKREAAELLGMSRAHLHLYRIMKTQGIK